MIRRALPYVVLLVVVGAVAAGLTFYVRGKLGAERDQPWSNMPKRAGHTDHSYLYKQKDFKTGPEVTRACLECHPEAGAQMLKSKHFLWVGDAVKVPGHTGEHRIGKKNLINNFCIGIESNWPKCTSCHAGYGWSDETFDFTRAEHIDCLVCHDQTGAYGKGPSGEPAQGVNLMAAAKSVGRPTRANCGSCHFNGGGGNAVKHGDLDGSLARPVERIDVHMGRADLQCIDCHQTKDHRISGKAMSVSVQGLAQMDCTQCHNEAPHRMDRLNEHTSALACQTCHIPRMAIEQATKIGWDWSTAGRDYDIDNPHVYLKIKGSFKYGRNMAPEYYWFNGNSERYLKNDPIDPDGVTHINYPMGGIQDADARIWPFKVHRAKQPYDLKLKHLIIPKTAGEGGFWTDFNWNQAGTLAEPVTGIEYSGDMGFAETDMYWPLSHMVQPKDRALQCTDCHGSRGRMNWDALGYDGDPAFTGGRRHRRLVVSKGGAQ
jgi:octaheme c-type cytochrome (tetrathionate reductase family)